MRNRHTILLMLACSLLLSACTALIPEVMLSGVSADASLHVSASIKNSRSEAIVVSVKCRWFNPVESLDLATATVVEQCMEPGEERGITLVPEGLSGDLRFVQYELYIHAVYPMSTSTGCF